MPLLQFIDLNLVPPGGWEFVQPELGWRTPNPVQDGFQKTVNMIVALRKNNPRFKLPTDPNLVALELQNFNCQKVPDRCRGPISPAVVNGVVYETAKKKKKGCGACGK